MSAGAKNKLEKTKTGIRKKHVDKAVFNKTSAMEKDIKKYQGELENEIAALRNVHEALGSGAWKLQYNAQGEMIVCWWSDAMRKMLGFTSVEEFPNQFESWSDRLHPEDKKRALAEYYSTVQDYSGKKTYDLEYRVMAKDGTYHWFRAAGRLSRRADGSPIAFDGVFINTDEKHETSEKLHKALQEAQNARNELLLEHEVISAVSRGFVFIYNIDLAQNFYEEISNQDYFIHRPTGQGGDAQSKLYELCRNFVAESYQSEVLRFFDLSDVAERIGSSDMIEIEYLAKDGNWHQARFLEKNEMKREK